MSYEPQYWINKPDMSTPMSAERLNHIEGGIADAHSDLESRLSEDQLVTLVSAAAVTSDEISRIVVPGVFGKRDVEFIVQPPRDFYTDFSGDALGALPGGWSKSWNTGRTWQVVAEPWAVGGRALRASVASGVETYDAVTCDQFATMMVGEVECELLFDWRVNAALRPPKGLMLGSGAVGSRAGYMCGPISSSQTGVIEIAGNAIYWGALGPLAALPNVIVSDVTYRTRFRKSGPLYSVKTWAASGAEPGWQFEGVSVTHVEGDLFGFCTDTSAPPSGAQQFIDRVAFHAGPGAAVYGG